MMEALMVVRELPKQEAFGFHLRDVISLILTAQDGSAGLRWEIPADGAAVIACLPHREQHSPDIFGHMTGFRIMQ
jgi:hypothetical protein